MGNLACIGGGGGGDVVEVEGSEGEDGEGEGGEGEGEGGEGEGGEGEGGEGEGGEGEGDEVVGVDGEGGELIVMLKASSSQGSLSFSGVVSSEVVRRFAAVPLLLARTAARWLARVAVIAAFALFRACGRALYAWARTVDGGGAGSVGCGVSGGGGEGNVAAVAAMPGVGVAGGGRLPAASLLSSLRLALLARSRLLLPETWALAWAAVSAAEESPPAAVERNQRVTSSEHPSVSSTSFAGIPPLLQRTHAIYWLCAVGGEQV